ncbi:hypothetical protein M9Y10_005136 [Tritrichomonas musculus]|uniref:Uncharacterized protein n=1 Tax=Tritrichomonas musculus TaxID=1915356 RepID=A0ABR2JKE5_9EUKA
MEQLKAPLESKTTDKLMDLLNSLKGYHETTEEYLNWVETEEELRGLLIHDIINDLITEKNYDGDNDCDVMYWFTKGIQSEKERQKMEEDAINDLMNMGYQEPIKHMKIPHVPKQLKQPKRYVDSEVDSIRGVRWLLKFAKTITLTLYGFTRSEQHSTVQNQFETHRRYIDTH